MPREVAAQDIRWFEIDPCYVFHPVNAFDEDGIITLYVLRQESALRAGAAGGHHSSTRACALRCTRQLDISLTGDRVSRENEF